jgi:hypothetical protein
MADKERITPPREKDVPKKKEIDPVKKPEKERHVEPDKPWDRTGKPRPPRPEPGKPGK